MPYAQVFARLVMSQLLFYWPRFLPFTKCQLTICEKSTWWAEQFGAYRAYNPGDESERQFPLPQNSSKHGLQSVGSICTWKWSGKIYHRYRHVSLSLYKSAKLENCSLNPRMPPALISYIFAWPISPFPVRHCQFLFIGMKLLVISVSLKKIKIQCLRNDRNWTTHHRSYKNIWNPIEMGALRLLPVRKFLKSGS